MKRNTVQKETIRLVFQQADRPLGVDEILQAGRERVRGLNQATVYRNVKALVEEGWLLKFSHPIFGTMFEKAGKDHHHHFHCRLCDRVFELPGCALNEKQATPDGFIAESHEVFLFGICSACSG